MKKGQRVASNMNKVQRDQENVVHLFQLALVVVKVNKRQRSPTCGNDSTSSLTMMVAILLLL
jgi:hypothetical protein